MIAVFCFIFVIGCGGAQAPSELRYAVTSHDWKDAYDTDLNKCTDRAGPAAKALCLEHVLDTREKIALSVGVKESEVEAPAKRSEKMEAPEQVAQKVEAAVVAPSAPPVQPSASPPVIPVAIPTPPSPPIPAVLSWMAPTGPSCDVHPDLKFVVNNDTEMLAVVSGMLTPLVCDQNFVRRGVMWKSGRRDPGAVVIPPHSKGIYVFDTYILRKEAKIDLFLPVEQGFAPHVGHLNTPDFKRLKRPGPYWQKLEGYYKRF